MLGKQFKKQQAYELGVFLCIVFSIFSSLQLFGKSPDYEGYLKIFTISSDVERPSTEPFFRLLRIINDFCFKSSIIPIYFISGLISLSIKWKSIRRLSRSNCLLIFFCYLISFYWIHEYTQFRAACAISIYFLALSELEKGNTKKFLLASVFAFFFHYSAVLIIGFYFFSRLSSEKKIYILLPLFGFAFAVFASSLSDQLREIVNTVALFFHVNNTGNVSNFMSPFNLKYLMVLLVFLFYSSVLDVEDRKNMLLMKSVSFGLCFYYWLNPVYLPVVSVRLAEFFTSVFIIWIFNCSKYIKIKEKKIMLLLPCCVVIIYAIASLRTIGVL